MTSLSTYDQRRYNRQMLIPGWGEAGQEKLKHARVFITGAGGLGSPVAMYLAAAGVGEIRICDADRVELSNLNRQILHSDDRVGELKAESARRTLQSLNPSLQITPITEYLNSENAVRIIGDVDIIIDCLDNYETRYLLNDYCIQHHIPLVHGAIWGWMGQLTFILPPETPCLKCIIPAPPENATFPVVGVTPGVIGCLQAMEVLKYLTNTGTNLKGRLLFFDGQDMSLDALVVRRAEACPACGHLV
jgi:molybdopterin/thiamine biosynthesis adenylyltransferase